MVPKIGQTLGTHEYSFKKINISQISYQITFIKRYNHISTEPTQSMALTVLWSGPAATQDNKTAPWPIKTIQLFNQEASFDKVIQ